MNYFLAAIQIKMKLLLDSTMEDIVSQLPLSAILKDALLEQEGIIGEALKCCIAFERADWENVQFQNIEEIKI